MRFPVLVAAALAAAVPLVPAVAQFGPQPITEAQPTLRTIPLTIRTAKTRLRFKVELAATWQQQRAGLMFRTAVPPFGGMLFPMDPVRTAEFWMHNTVIPLDMVFIRTDGTIARVATAHQLSDAITSSGEPVAAVLELRAGRAEELGIRAGDTVRWHA